MSLNPAPTLKLWYSPGACSLASHILLLETGLEFETIYLQVGKFTNDFLNVNPKGLVPVLAMDDDIITEMPAILTAISFLQPGRQLLGKSNLEIVRTYEWLNYLSGTLHGQGYGALWRPERFVEDPRSYPDIQRKGIQRIKQCYGLIEDNFKSDGRLYAVGNSFTIVDPFLLVFFLWGKRVGVDMTEYPNFMKWAGLLLQRESVCQALKIHSRM